MKKVLVILAPGFEEIETVTVVDILRRAGARVTVAGTEKGPIQGSRGMNILPDSLLSTTNAEDFEMVVLPGGATGDLQSSKGLPGHRHNPGDECPRKTDSGYLRRPNRSQLRWHS